jgi:hypothetical protein
MKAKALVAGLAFSSMGAFAQTTVVEPTVTDPTVANPQGTYVITPADNASSGAGAPPATYGTAATAGTYVNCNSLTGAERERCLNAATAAPVGVPITLIPGASGPGAIDKTHPGLERGIGPSPRDAGTSSAGSP